MKVRLLFPRNPATDGYYLENLTIYSARRCRTTKTAEELWDLEKAEWYLHHLIENIRRAQDKTVRFPEVEPEPEASE